MGCCVLWAVTFGRERSGAELRGNPRSVAVAVRIKSEGRTRGMGAAALTLGLASRGAPGQSGEAPGQRELRGITLYCKIGVLEVTT